MKARSEMRNAKIAANRREADVTVVAGVAEQRMISKWLYGGQNELEWCRRQVAEQQSRGNGAWMIVRRLRDGELAVVRAGSREQGAGGRGQGAGGRVS